MYEYVKEKQLRMKDTNGGLIAEALQQYFDVGEYLLVLNCSFLTFIGRPYCTKIT